MSGPTDDQLAAVGISRGEFERAVAARPFIHEQSCPSTTASSCAACPGPVELVRAMRVLDAAPRDAKSARRALHDVVCTSGCGPDSDHADRTQFKRVAALRKWLAREVAA